MNQIKKDKSIQINLGKQGFGEEEDNDLLQDLVEHCSLTKEKAIEIIEGMKNTKLAYGYKQLEELIDKSEDSSCHMVT